MISSKKKKVTFLLILEEKIPDVNFTLKNLPASSKIDVVARNILATFPTFINFNVNYMVLFTKNNPAVLTVINLVARRKPYDEIEIASLIKESLQLSLDQHDKLNQNIDPSLQFFNWEHTINIKSFLHQIEETNESVFYLQENGLPFNDLVQDLNRINSCCFIFGGRHDLSPEMEKHVKSIITNQISLGKRSYLASTCITFLLFELKKFEKS